MSSFTASTWTVEAQALFVECRRSCALYSHDDSGDGGAEKFLGQCVHVLAYDQNAVGLRLVGAERQPALRDPLGPFHMAAEQKVL